MVNRQAGIVLDHVQRILAARCGEQLSDRELLERFTSTNDEQAFAALVKRHGGMIFNVCRRILHNEHDAEDAFQAAFLVLARKASARSWQESVGPWLYRVAYRLALRVKADAQRQAHYDQLPKKSSPADPMAIASGRELCAALDEELSRLPERLRAPLVLCCLESCTRDEAALQLGLSLSVLKHRLEDGRAQLRQRLLRRGFPLSAVLAAGLWSEQTVHAAFHSKLVPPIVEAARSLVSGTAAQLSVSARVIILMEETVKGMSYTRLQAALVIVLSICLVGTAGGLALRRSEDATIPNATTARQESPAQKTNAEAPTGEAPLVLDQHGDPLPEEVSARLGTMRFRSAKEISSLAYTHDGKFILSGGTDGVHLWDAATGKEISWLGSELKGRYGPAALSQDGKKVAVAGWGQEDGLAVYELASGRLLFRYGKYCDTVVPAGFSPDGKTLAVSYGANTAIELVDADRGVAVRSLREYLDPNLLGHLTHHQVAFSSDGKTLIYPNKDGIIQVEDVATGKELRRLATVPVGIADMVLSPDGRRLAFTSLIIINQPKLGGQSTGFGENRIHIWDVALGKEIREIVVGDGAELQLPPPYDNVKPRKGPHVLAFSPDGKLLAAGGSDRGARMWEVSTGKEVNRAQQDMLNVSALTFSPDGKFIAVADSFQCIRLWELSTGRVSLAPGGHRSGIRSVFISPDSRQVATAGEDGAIYLWNRASGQQVGKLAGHKDRVDNLAYSADGHTLFSAGNDKKLRFWNLANGRELRAPHVCKSWSPQLLLSPDGKTLAWVEAWKTVRLFDAVTGNEFPALAGTNEFIKTIHFSDDSRTLMAWSAAQSLHFWNLATGKHTQRRCPPESYSAAFSPDGKFIALGGFDTVVLKDVATGEEVRRFTGLSPKTNQGVGTLVFSADGRSLAWGGAGDTVIELGEVASGQVRRRLAGHRSGIQSLTFSNDGKALISGSNDTTALVWDLTAGPRSKGNRTVGPAALDSLWADLAAKDAARAYVAIRTLASVPGQAIPYFQKRLFPVPPVDNNRILKLIADLDSIQFADRRKATLDLEQLGEIAEAEFQKTLAAKPSLEACLRLDELRNKLRNLPPERLRVVRAVEALELTQTPEARKFLAVLAQGAPQARLTQDAHAALERYRMRVTSH